MTLGYAILILLAIVLLGALIAKTLLKRKEKPQPVAKEDPMADWEVGDNIMLALKKYDDILKEHGMKFAKLIAWNDKEVLVDLGDKMTTAIPLREVHDNHSCIWRRKYKSCKEKMGEAKWKQAKEYTPVTNIDTSKVLVDGKPISTMNETQLNVYITKALDDGDKELFAALTKELERFR